MRVVWYCHSQMQRSLCEFHPYFYLHRNHLKVQDHSLQLKSVQPAGLYIVQIIISCRCRLGRGLTHQGFDWVEFRLFSNCWTSDEKGLYACLSEIFLQCSKWAINLLCAFFSITLPVCPVWHPRVAEIKEMYGSKLNLTYVWPWCRTRSTTYSA